MDLNNPSQTLGPQTPVSESKTLRILLVEDHGDTAAILTRQLKRLGHDVIYASTVADALLAATHAMNQAGLNLVISDVGLPDASGLDLMRQLSSQFGLKGLAISGFGTESDIAQSKSAGFVRHLTKPIDSQNLKKTIAEIAVAL